jgi:hypothetical protein
MVSLFTVQGRGEECKQTGPEYIASNGTMIVNNELERNWKEALFSCNLPGGRGKLQINPKTEEMVPQASLKLSTS